MTEVVPAEALDPGLAFVADNMGLVIVDEKAKESEILPEVGLRLHGRNRLPYRVEVLSNDLTLTPDAAEVRDVNSQLCFDDFTMRPSSFH